MSLYFTGTIVYGVLFLAFSVTVFQFEGEMYVDHNNAKCFETLSLMVSQILDQITASEEVRQLWMKIGTSRNSLDYLMVKLGINTDYLVYLMGSAFEGTRTPGMKSDLNFLCSKLKYLVVQNIKKASYHSDCLLLVKDKHTKPGYVKLQLVQKGMPVFKHLPDGIKSFTLDCYGRVVCIREALKGVLTDECHGPAETELKRPMATSADFVQAFRCQEHPHIASAWFSRKRKFNWPSKNLIAKMTSLGFFVVPVGHPNSPEKDKEWRISLSLQERLLMQNLNTTQFQYYVLLKLIKKDIISHMVNGQSLTSYHLKTCLFYSIEESPPEFWKPHHLLLCLRKCLNKLYVLVRNKSCPNYFIPEENMFEGRIEGDLRARVEHALKTLLTTDFHYLLYIKCDSFNEVFRQSCLGEPIKSKSIKIGKQKILIMPGELNELLTNRLKLMHKCSSGFDLKAFFLISVGALFVLSLIKSTNIHGEQDISKAKSLLLPYIEQCIMTSAITNLVEQDTKPVNMVDILLSEEWNGLCRASGSVSAKIKQATYLHTFGYYEASLTVLEKVISEDVIPSFMSGCKCRNSSFHEDLIYGEMLGLLVQISNASDSEFRKRFWAPCVIFLPQERALIPRALQYEKQRSVGMPHETKLFWYDWAAVDSRILLYFLRYLNFYKLGKKRSSLRELITLAVFLRDDPNLGHLETGLNLLGWALVDENDPYMALKALQLSLVLKRQHNAAVWLLGTIINTRDFSEVKIKSYEYAKLWLTIQLVRDHYTTLLFHHSPEYLLHDDCPLYLPVPVIDGIRPIVKR